MAKKPTKAGKEILPNTIQTEILLRALGAEGLKDMWEKYKAKRIRSKTKAPTELQYKMAEARRRGDNVKHIIENTKKYAHVTVSQAQVYEAVKRVAVFEYLKKE